MDYLDQPFSYDDGIKQNDIDCLSYYDAVYFLKKISYIESKNVCNVSNVNNSNISFVCSTSQKSSLFTNLIIAIAFLVIIVKCSG